MSEPIQILIADDHTLFRDGLRAVFSSRPETAVVGEAGDGQQAVALAEELQPDVVLMDIQMPHLNGIEATRRIVQTSPHIGVIMVTMFEDDESVFAAMRAVICSKGRIRRRCYAPSPPKEKRSLARPLRASWRPSLPTCAPMHPRVSSPN